MTLPPARFDEIRRRLEEVQQSSSGLVWREEYVADVADLLAEVERLEAELAGLREPVLDAALRAALDAREQEQA